MVKPVEKIYTGSERQFNTDADAERRRLEAIGKVVAARAKNAIYGKDGKLKQNDDSVLGQNLDIKI